MDALHHFHSIHSLNGAAENALRSVIKVNDLPKNKVIQRPGSTCRTLYFVEDGIARIFYRNQDHEVTEHFAYDGNMIIRAESLFTGQPTPKGIQAVTDIRLAIIDAQKLFDLFERNHEIERLFHKVIIREYVATIHRAESFQMKTATTRYLELLNATPLLQHVPLKHIASYLGITQVSLSRIRAGVK
ncbi:MAG TPA: Crp/Fnr family transcriptional regulator [Flavobacteriales bacterium]|nr:Crp/Fnr family transcriptional regulator [Flavobacteriales bacterium]HMR28681.1 Crp/Fnr family transcriptional regulator [Flavobacteriales bacterium]